MRACQRQARTSGQPPLQLHRSQPLGALLRSRRAILDLASQSCPSPFDELGDPSVEGRFEAPYGPRSLHPRHHEDSVVRVRGDACVRGWRARAGRPADRVRAGRGRFATGVHRARGRRRHGRTRRAVARGDAQRPVRAGRSSPDDDRTRRSALPGWHGARRRSVLGRGSPVTDIASSHLGPPHARRRGRERSGSGGALSDRHAGGIGANRWRR